MFHIPRWKRLTLATSLAVSMLSLSTALSTQAIAAGKKTITAVKNAPLRANHPTFTNAYINRDHSYLFSDHLPSVVSNFTNQPPTEDLKVGHHQLTYTLLPRAGF